MLRLESSKYITMDTDLIQIKDTNQPVWNELFWVLPPGVVMVYGENWNDHNCPLADFAGINANIL